MKIEKLTENKLRIVLDINELNEKNIDFLSLTKHTDETQKLFKKILKRAEKEVDFHVEDCKLLIEAFISSDGFFIITFTKLDSEKNTSIGIPTKIKIKRKSQVPINTNAIYKFDTLEDFSHFCTYINNFDLDKLNNIYKEVSLYEYNNNYYLIFNKINTDLINISCLYLAISEFSNLASNSSILSSKLIESGKPIFKDNALNNGINFFKTL